MQPFFTVVMPSYNHGKFLRKALSSLLEQHVDDLEIIVVDGQSTDGSVAILKEYAERLGGVRFGEGGEAGEKLETGNLKLEGSSEGLGRRSEVRGEVLKCENSKMSVRETEKEMPPNFRIRFLWCSEPDRGQSHAFNKGFARANGRFLFWLNADDVLLPGTLRRVYDYVQKNGLGVDSSVNSKNCVIALLRYCVIATSMFRVRRSALSVHPPRIEWIAGNQIYIDAKGRILRCSRGNHWHDFLYRNAPVHVYGPSSFFTKDLLDRVGGFDERLRYCMDWDLWLKFRGAGARFHRLDHYCWALRQHDGSKTQGGEKDKVDLHWQEIYAMCNRNGLVITRGGLLLQRLWRLLAGCYFRSMWDTIVWRVCHRHVCT